jgi:Na+-driven multidrug efflux pump
VAASYLLIEGIGPFPKLEATGAAIGDVIGPVPSVALCLWLIYSGRSFVGPPDKFTLRPDFDILWRIAKLGVPSGIQAVLLNIGGAFLLYFINRLPQSAEALAAYTVCYSQLFSVVTWTGFGLRAACATVIGQNIGAGKPDRGARAVYFGAGIGAVWAALIGLMYWVIPGQLLAMFSLRDVAVSDIAETLLHFLAFSGVFVVVTLAITGGLQGAGDTKKPMYIALVTQIFVLLGICFVMLQLGRLTPVAIWTAILISHASRLTLTMISFARGSWRTIKVELGEHRVPGVGLPVLTSTAEAASRDAVGGA